MSLINLEPLPEFTNFDAEAPWYVTCTYPRHEKRVRQQLDERGIGAFLPLYASVRRWKDRRKVVDLPLFPGYVFVRVRPEMRLDVLRLPGVFGLVCFQGRPARIESGEIRNLRYGLIGRQVAQPHPYLKVGRRVRVRMGAMAGLEGILVRKKDSFRVVLSISLIQRSISVEVDQADIELAQ
jgi:transcription antitermination factor NusG